MAQHHIDFFSKIQEGLADENRIGNLAEKLANLADCPVEKRREVIAEKEQELARLRKNTLEKVSALKTKILQISSQALPNRTSSTLSSTIQDMCKILAAEQAFFESLEINPFFVSDTIKPILAKLKRDRTKTFPDLLAQLQPLEGKRESEVDDSKQTHHRVQPDPGLASLIQKYSDLKAGLTEELSRRGSEGSWQTDPEFAKQLQEIQGESLLNNMPGIAYTSHMLLQGSLPDAPRFWNPSDLQTQTTLLRNVRILFLYVKSNTALQKSTRNAFKKGFQELHSINKDRGGPL
ncbi:MAG: hypothetical protein AAGF04_01965 [Chlamydiota bacterium]